MNEIANQRILLYIYMEIILNYPDGTTVISKVLKS